MLEGKHEMKSLKPLQLQLCCTCRQPGGRLAAAATCVHLSAMYDRFMAAIRICINTARNLTRPLINQQGLNDSIAELQRVAARLYCVLTPLSLQSQ